MKNTLDTVLLLALPASGKSEVRRYLHHLSPDICRDEFHMGPTVQLDDFPYVHLMRRIDDELEKLGQARVFFKSGERPFIDPRDWGTLIWLVNEDYADLVARKALAPAAVAPFLFDRIEAAAAKVGIPARLGKLDAGARASVAKTLEKEAADWLKEKTANYPDTLKGKTLVIEFARGGPDGSKMPLKAPFGYEYSIGQLAPAILEKASILYVWVTPEESRRKNQARTNPDDPGSILHHGVPMEVMLNDYGVCDMDWLESQSQPKGTITVAAGGKKHVLPVGRFDNRKDKTSFLRADPKDWNPDDVKAVHEGLRGALDRLAAFRA